MIINNAMKNNILLIVCLLVACVGFGAVIVFDGVYAARGVLGEGLPDFSPSYLIRSSIVFISILAVCWSLIGRNKPDLLLDDGDKLSWARLSILTTLFFSIVLLCLFIFTPSIFSTLSLEDGPVEYGSALILFFSCIVFVVLFFRTLKHSHAPVIIKLSLAFLSLVFFVIAMEEVSWFQRVLEIKTPRIFRANIQGEMNFHNFATNYVENVYYFGVFVFLVVFSFIRFVFPYISNNNYLSIFVARPFVGVVGTIACAYNFDMWNVIFTQIAFFSSVIILLVFAIFSHNKKDRHIILFSFVVIVATQLVFLMNGVNFQRMWEVTEYKELFIPIALFVYALDVRSHINRKYVVNSS